MKLKPILLSKPVVTVAVFVASCQTQADLSVNCKLITPVSSGCTTCQYVAESDITWKCDSDFLPKQAAKCSAMSSMEDGTLCWFTTTLCPGNQFIWPGNGGCVGSGAATTTCSREYDTNFNNDLGDDPICP
jgi:hypothetical protein